VKEKRSRVELDDLRSRHSRHEEERHRAEKGEPRHRALGFPGRSAHQLQPQPPPFPLVPPKDPSRFSSTCCRWAISRASP